jgi:hypothetical protein
MKNQPLPQYRKQTSKRQGNRTFVSLDGNPGLGKSFETLSIAAMVSSGTPFPDNKCPGRKHSVILLNAEDHPAKTIRPRLEAMEADLSRIKLLTSVRSYNEEKGPSQEEELLSNVVDEIFFDSRAEPLRGLI